MNCKTFVAVLVAVSVFFNSVTTCVAADVISSGFKISTDFSTYYDFELCPKDAKVSEIISDTLGSQHTIKWENPSNLPSGYQVEIYAVCEFSIYASDNWLGLVSWNEIESSTNKDWQSVDTPYIKVYEDNALENDSCVINFDSLMQYITTLYISNSNFEDSLGGITQNSALVQRFIKFCNILTEYGTSVLGVNYTDIVDMYTYTINGNECKDFRFSKMKYYIRYKKAVEPQEPLQSDGKYHYYLETWKPLNRAAGKPSNEFEGLPSGVYVGFTYTGGDEKVMDNCSHYLDYRVKYEIISPYPICFVSGEKLANGIDYYAWYNVDGSIRYRSYNTTIRTRTEKGVQENNGTCQLYVLVNNDGNEEKVINPSYGSRWDDIPNLAALDMVASSGTYQTNIPIFAAAFSTAADDYLLTGALDYDENGNSWFMPGGGWQYGQLLQCTVAFADGGASLDKNSQTEKLDGVSDSNNGWLKKIYYLLKDNLINEDGDSWLAKIHKRLEWTNTYLKALIAENTIADLGGFVADFISDKLDAAVNGVLDTVEGAAIITAGKTITDAASSKFPFSIYTDCVVLAEAFVAEPETPQFTIRLKYADEIDEKVELDFKKIDKLAKVSRSFCYLIFCAGLVKKTRDFVVMIDGGSKIS